MKGIRRYLFKKLILGLTKGMAGIRRYLFRKLMLVYTKVNGWYM